MRTTTTITMALLGMVMSVHGQGASRLTSPTPNPNQKKQLEDAANKLREADSGGQLDKARSTAKGLLEKLPGGVTDAAKSALQSPELKAQATEAAKSLLPEAQKFMNSRNAADQVGGLPPGAAPTVPAADQPPAAAAPEGPKPQALQPIAQTGAPTKRAPVAVIEADNSVFDPNTNILIYTGHVRARHPQFYIECEELIVYLIKEEKTDGKKPEPKKPAANDPILAKGGAKKEPEKNSSVKKAIASGPMVHIEKANEKGEIQRADCRKAVYDGITGNIIMSDSPQVQTGNVMQIAITPDTVMTFDQKGNFTSSQRTRTVILQEGETPPVRSNGL